MKFTKDDTSAVKGFAILMMLFHHLFLAPERYAGYDVSFSPLGETRTVLIAQFCKICVAVFVFLSGYGITISMKKLKDGDKLASRRQVAKRYFSLMSGFWFVYIVCLVTVLVFDRSILSCYSANNLFNSIYFAFVDFMGLANLFGTPTMIGTWWYMSLAVIIVVAVPILYKLYERFGTVALLVVTMCLCGIFEQKNYDMVRWFFTLALGMIFAEKDLLAKFKSFKFVKFKVLDYVIKLVLYTAALVACFYARNYADWTVSYLRDGIIPVVVVMWLYTVLFEIKPIYVVLKYLGYHSMNIFLSHTLLRGYLLKGFIYSKGNFLVIFLILILLSLGFAIVIDLLETFTGYKKFTKFVTKKIMGE
ncbi:MAG: acyltransferase family protein [Clostridia bacterium]|nr:acyltransferase family protein [Clostridia bacterium]